MIEKSNTAKLRDSVLVFLQGAMNSDDVNEVKRNAIGWRDRSSITTIAQATSRIVSDLLKLNLIDACQDKVRISREGIQYLLDERSSKFVLDMNYDEKQAILWMYTRKERDNRNEKETRRRVTDGACFFPRDKFKEIDFVHLLEKGLIYNCCSSHGVRDLIWLSPFGIQIGEYLTRKKFW